jgi:hypothetical protein
MLRGEIDPSHTLHVTAVSADGRWALGQLWQRRDPRTENGTVVLIDISSQSRQVLHIMPSPAHQAGLADTDGRWFVWQESSQQPNFGDWTLYAFDRESGKLHELARAPEPPPGRQLGSSIWPQVDHGVALWAQEVPDSTDLRWGNIISKQLPDGPQQVLATRARGVVISWPYAAWAEERPGSNGGTILIRYNLETGQRTALSRAVDPVYATIAGESTAWVANWNELWLADTPDGPKRLVARALAGEGFIQFPRLGSRLIGWENTARPAMFDRVLDRLVLVDEPAAAGTVWNFRVKGDTAWWAIPSRDPKALEAARVSGLPATSDYAVLDSSTLRSR